jgi:hypothetical protein
VQGDGTGVEIYNDLLRVASSCASGLCRAHSTTIKGRLKEKTYCRRPEGLTLRLSLIPMRVLRTRIFLYCWKNE